MRSRTIRLILIVPLALTLLLVATVWLADNWLESSGGREMLESELSRRIGMPVRLQGEFDLTLYPAIGVSGTDLVVGGSGPESAFIRSREFAISIALRPLLERRLVIEQVAVGDMVIHPDRFYRAEESSDGTALRLDYLTVSGFAVDRVTPFAFEIEGLVSVQGNFRWAPSRSAIYFDGLHLSTTGGEARGEGCVFLRSPVSLRLDLEAEALDLDSIRERLPQIRAGGDGAGIDTRVRLRADSLKGGGAIARGAEFLLGSAPDCETEV